MNQINVRYDSLAEIWNTFDGFQSLLEVNDEAHDHKTDRAECEGISYKRKSDMERLLASREAGSMAVAAKLEAWSSSDSTASSDTNPPVTGVTLKLSAVSLPTLVENMKIGQPFKIFSRSW
jgi:hypothetical protein